MVAEHTITIPNRNGRILYCTFTPAAVPGPRPVVVLLHGFKGFRNWSFWPVAAQAFADHGFHVIRMDFALNGMRGTNERVISTDDFAANTLMAEVHDTHDLLQAIEHHEAFAVWRSRFDPQQLHLIGHSRGGGIALIVGRQLLDLGKPLTSVTGWNSVGRWDRIGSHQLEQWRERGYYEIQNARTQQTLRMSYSYVEEYLAHREELSLVEAARRLGERAHFVHAETDMTVPLQEVQALRSQSNERSTLDVIPGSTHTFGMQHPVDHVTPAFTQAIHITLQHLEHHV